MIANENQMLKEMANNRIPIKARDLNKRDDDLISKVNILA